MSKFNSSQSVLLIHQVYIKMIRVTRKVLILVAAPWGNLSWSINCFPSPRPNRWDHWIGIDPQDWTCSTPFSPGDLEVVFILQESCVVFFHCSILFSLSLWCQFPKWIYRTYQYMSLIFISSENWKISQAKKMEVAKEQCIKIITKNTLELKLTRFYPEASAVVLFDKLKSTNMNSTISCV